MPIAPELLELLRCPLTGQRLTVAPPDLLAKVEAQRRAGSVVMRAGQPQWNAGEPLEDFLIREDGRLGYPVQAGIPLLLPDHAIEIPLPAQG